LEELQGIRGWRIWNLDLKGRFEFGIEFKKSRYEPETNASKVRLLVSLINDDFERLK
jgi:hypothetical protein